MAAKPIEWEPSVQEVADHIPARTKTKGGKRVGTFTADTWPTAEDAERKIALAARRVASAIGAKPCTDDLAEDARAATAIYAAMLIESGYYPEQTRHEGSAFRTLESLWKDQIKTLTEAVGEQCGGGDGDAVGGSGQTPVGHFDDRDIVGPGWPAW